MSQTICVSCVMDRTDPDITFNSDGVCIHCLQYTAKRRADEESRHKHDRSVDELIQRLKVGAQNRRYDCVIGLSGGVDSSYTALKVVDLGLRPLAVHLDNGWNSELAVGNIEHLVKRLRIDLITHVVNWAEFRALQRAFFAAGVPDIEMLTDHAILATLYRVAARYSLHNIIIGNNLATEAVMPTRWNFNKLDLRHIRDIARRFAPRQPILSMPTLSLRRYLYYRFLRGIKMTAILNYLSYSKTSAEAELTARTPWRAYPAKHYESIFTRFYQAHILPTKFNIDKRKAHLSSLILSGQMTRCDAIRRLQEPLYEPRLLAQDRAFVIKKLGYSEDELSRYLAAPGTPHQQYMTSEDLWQTLGFINRQVKRWREPFSVNRTAK